MSRLSSNYPTIILLNVVLPTDNYGFDTFVFRHGNLQEINQCLIFFLGACGSAYTKQGTRARATDETQLISATKKTGEVRSPELTVHLKQSIYFQVQTTHPLADPM